MTKNMLFQLNVVHKDATLVSVECCTQECYCSFTITSKIYWSLGTLQCSSELCSALGNFAVL